jgi:hypothetical protein
MAGISPPDALARYVPAIAAAANLSRTTRRDNAVAGHRLHDRPGEAGNEA